MRIEIELTEAPAMEPPELWMRVLSDKLLDLPTAVKNLDPEQAEVFAGYHPTPSRFLPSGAYDDPNPDHGFQFEDWWIFRKRSEG